MFLHDLSLKKNNKEREKEKNSQQRTLDNLTLQLTAAILLLTKP